jgi:hypothetical protein
MDLRGPLLPALGLLAMAAHAGPFALEKGMTLEQVRTQGDFQPSKTAYWFDAPSMKNGHADFEKYSVLVTPTHGLCKIIATGRNITTSSFGSEVQEAHSRLREALTSKYGQPTNNYDFLKAGSIWRERNEWMMALVRKERVLATFWTDKPRLPDSLQGIHLEARGLSTSTGYVILDYEFEGSNECVDMVRAQRNSNL